MRSNPGRKAAESALKTDGRLQPLRHLAGPRLRRWGSGLEARLGREQWRRFGGRTCSRRRLRRARAHLRALLPGVLGELFDLRLKRGRELRGRRRLLAQIPEGLAGVCVKGVRGRWGGGAESEGGAGAGGISGHAAVQELWQLQLLENGLAD